MDALRPVKPWRTKAPVRIRRSGIAALGETTTRGDAGTLLNAATIAKTHMAEIHAMELEPRLINSEMQQKFIKEVCFFLLFAIYKFKFLSKLKAFFFAREFFFI